jgi:hypothetical protein
MVRSVLDLRLDPTASLKHVLIGCKLDPKSILTESSLRGLHSLNSQKFIKLLRKHLFIEEEILSTRDQIESRDCEVLGNSFEHRFGGVWNLICEGLLIGSLEDLIETNSM